MKRSRFRSVIQHIVPCLTTAGNRIPFVVKAGLGVRKAEAMALYLIARYTDVPVPTVLEEQFGGRYGRIKMSDMPGTTLASKWDHLSSDQKQTVCSKIWALIASWKDITRPARFQDVCCLADGQPIQDLLLRDSTTDEEQIGNLTTGAQVRERISKNFDISGNAMASKAIPVTDQFCFTHGDIDPSNIMVDDDNNMTAVVDWECAGWYPDYWEYAKIMKPNGHIDFQNWMHATAPKIWNVAAISSVRAAIYMARYRNGLP
ncbi:hypothetical protein BO71DRAFT_327674 [Aspergillus ellipticus CBS 707.79]|uniref:Aminoglycoside phosphotransferase domain-containing protein n=1 Tax=Aspergillus ellipticus CBS 707.79 TaxID=1448320 RepID=A0A319DYZ5_9EURO|nr:hypothetical protein BO71DRAFT_327674 [Aspergillus ellipticus CBS 707.79]